MAEEEKVQDQESEEEEKGFSIVEVAAVFFNQGALCLGAIPHPQTGKPYVNFAAAQESIGMLEVLTEKVQGNVTPDENKVLEKMLSELKMAFVQAIRDPKVREMAERMQLAEEQQASSSTILAPDGRPASSSEDRPRIIIP